MRIHGISAATDSTSSSRQNSSPTYGFVALTIVGFPFVFPASFQRRELNPSIQKSMNPEIPLLDSPLNLLARVNNSSALLKG